VALGELLADGLRKATFRGVTFLVPSAGTEGKSEATLAFRPEDIQETEDLSSTNKVVGQVESVSFLGSTARVMLKIEGTTMVFDRHCPKEEDIPAIGETLQVCIPPSACLLFDKQSGERLGAGGER
jgi:ABC-type Fe3+/spermidine/putrescine transport system ATPase subunit